MPRRRADDGHKHVWRESLAIDAPRRGRARQDVRTGRSLLGLHKIGYFTARADERGVAPRPLILDTR